jgi:AbrB family looped-hinge helix DNA binding protein
MTTIVKIHRKGQMTLPTQLRTLAGIAEGDLVEAVFSRGKIVITPKIVIDRSQFPNADHEYTPAQRRAIDRGIAQSEREYKQGRSFGPFATHEEFIASLHKEAAKPDAKKTKRSAMRLDVSPHFTRSYKKAPLSQALEWVTVAAIRSRMRRIPWSTQLDHLPAALTTFRHSLMIPSHTIKSFMSCPKSPRNTLKQSLPTLLRSRIWHRWPPSRMSAKALKN